MFWVGSDNICFCRGGNLCDSAIRAPPLVEAMPPSLHKPWYILFCTSRGTPHTAKCFLCDFWAFLSKLYVTLIFML